METRTIKELLILLRDFFPGNINTIYNSGSLCYAIADMKGADILTAGEYSMLGDYIENHRPDNKFVDHKDNNGLDNQRDNLRICTVSQNLMNQRPHGISGIKGVRFFKGKYLAQLRLFGKYIHLGTFNTADEAKDAYNIAAIKYQGEFAYINK